MSSLFHSSVSPVKFCLPGNLSVTDDEVFYSLAGVGIGWMFLIFFPRFRYTQSIVLFIALCYAAVYTFLGISIVFINGKQVDPKETMSLGGLVKLFRDRDNVLLGWTHYIVFDLMVARYIIADSGKRGIPYFLIFWTVPLTCMLGPMGLLSYETVKGVYGMIFGLKPTDDKVKMA